MSTPAHKRMVFAIVGALTLHVLAFAAVERWDGLYAHDGTPSTGRVAVAVLVTSRPESGGVNNYDSRESEHSEENQEANDESVVDGLDTAPANAAVTDHTTSKPENGRHDTRESDDLDDRPETEQADSQSPAAREDGGTPPGATSSPGAANAAASNQTAPAAIEPVRLVPPSYPEVARARGEQGAVVVQIEIGRGGRVAGVQLTESSGYALLDDAAVRAVRAWRFASHYEGQHTARRFEFRLEG